MGYYVNPERQSKMSWLNDNGRMMGESVKSPPPPGYHYVCVVNNGAFLAAGIAYDERERQAFAIPDDREKLWFLVPDNKLIEIEPRVKDRLQ